MTPAELEAVRLNVDQAPPLTADQIALLRAAGLKGRQRTRTGTSRRAEQNSRRAS